jgi:uncharacterized protein (DUF1810 family)
MPDSFDLDRFVEAQEQVHASVLDELRAGRKTSHWIWFIFPQLKGLGRSWMAEHYGIASRAEAEAYLNHPVLGPRLEECTRLVNGVEGGSIREILGDIDATKFRSSMTLFAAVSKDGSVYAEALGKWFRGRPDPLTVERL